jgi:hypothetical protein
VDIDPLLVNTHFSILSKFPEAMNSEVKNGNNKENKTLHSDKDRRKVD